MRSCRMRNEATNSAARRQRQLGGSACCYCSAVNTSGSSTDVPGSRRIAHVHLERMQHHWRIWRTDGIEVMEGCVTDVIDGLPRLRQCFRHCALPVWSRRRRTDIHRRNLLHICCSFQLATSPTPVGGVRSILMSVRLSVCLSVCQLGCLRNHTVELHKILYTRWLWPYLGHPSAASPYIMQFPVLWITSFFRTMGPMARVVYCLAEIE